MPLRDTAGEKQDWKQETAIALNNAKKRAESQLSGWLRPGVRYQGGRCVKRELALTMV